MVIVLGLVVAVGVVVGLAFLMLRFAENMVGRTVGGNSEDAEQILATGCVPEAWLVDFRGKRPRVRRGMNKAKAMRRLRKLIRYYRGTPVVPDERSRAQTISSLRQTLDRWRGAPWSEILPTSMRG